MFTFVPTLTNQNEMGHTTGNKLIHKCIWVMSSSYSYSTPPFTPAQIRAEI